MGLLWDKQTWHNFGKNFHPKVPLNLIYFKLHLTSKGQSISLYKKCVPFNTAAQNYPELTFCWDAPVITTWGTKMDITYKQSWGSTSFPCKMQNATLDSRDWKCGRRFCLLRPTGKRQPLIINKFPKGRLPLEDYEVHMSFPNRFLSLFNAERFWLDCIRFLWVSLLVVAGLLPL